MFCTVVMSHLGVTFSSIVYLRGKRCCTTSAFLVIFQSQFHISVLKHIKFLLMLHHAKMLLLECTILYHNEAVPTVHTVHTSNLGC